MGYRFGIVFLRYGCGIGSGEYRFGPGFLGYRFGIGFGGYRFGVKYEVQTTRSLVQSHPPSQQIGNTPNGTCRIGLPFDFFLPDKPEQMHVLMAPEQARN